MKEQPSRGCLDEPTLERLYVRLERPMYNVVYRWVWNDTDAQDLVQEAFVRLWQMRERVDLVTVEALVYRIALNLASKRRRSTRIWKWVSLAALKGHTRGGSAETSLLERERTLSIRRAIDGLPEKLKQVVLLTEFTDLKYGEIGEVLSIPAGTVASRRNAALKVLRRHLGEKEGEDDAN